ncbi:hypothetical protein [Pseudomonas maumuensis]|uniref:Uncharacterized protein n=1 Tax=Pseudomonas maumuensis TaxID=2842354 RepID=A0ABX8NRV7_9PSED|nr:hypothetical protein [Pseudomonas maumuensis]QXH58835.1 hypothetical protein KSS90_11700 [Pseudomonas maumuensis]
MQEFMFVGVGPEPTRMWGDTPLFNLEDGGKLLDFCEVHDAAVLGVEGFKIVGDKRIPDLDCIADFSSLAVSAGKRFPAASRESARYFLDTISGSDVLLEFVIVRV